MERASGRERSVRGDKGTIPPPIFQATIVKSKLYHLPSSARDVDENLPCLGGFFLKGRDYLLNIARRLATYALTIASMPPAVQSRLCLILLLECVCITADFRRVLDRAPIAFRIPRLFARTAEYALLG